MPPAVSDVRDFARLLQQAVADGRFVSLVLSGLQTAGDQPDRHDVRPIARDGAVLLQWSYRRERQMLHENLDVRASQSRLETLFGSVYRNAVLRLTDAEHSARFTKRGQLQVSRQAVSLPAAATQHDRAPQHLLPAGTPCPFLEAIGVMTADGRVRTPQQHKFRQINRYLEFVRDVLPDLPAEGRLEIVDCGCGKSGLTFALRHYLAETSSRDVHVVGLDWNADVLATCRGIADRLGLNDIEFRAGDIASYTPPGPVHLVVSLHACDTATDAALAQAVRWQSDVILAVPCCQHELAPQLASAPLAALLEHGILRERLAADVTDALRAARLELAGYKTQVLEFIDLEHTPKNLLLRAVQRRDALTVELLDQRRRHYDSLRAEIGVRNFALDRLLPLSDALIGVT